VTKKLAWKALSDEEREQPYVTKAAAAKNNSNDSKDYDKKLGALAITVGGVGALAIHLPPKQGGHLTTCELLSLSSDLLFPLLKVPELLLLRQTSHEVRIIVDSADTWLQISRVLDKFNTERQPFIESDEQPLDYEPRESGKKQTQMDQIEDSFRGLGLQHRFTSQFPRLDMEIWHRLSAFEQCYKIFLFSCAAVERLKNHSDLVSKAQAAAASRSESRLKTVAQKVFQVIEKALVEPQHDATEDDTRHFFRILVLMESKTARFKFLIISILHSLSFNIDVSELSSSTQSRRSI
jgi:hypothetical protein